MCLIIGQRQINELVTNVYNRYCFEIEKVRIEKEEEEEKVYNGWLLGECDLQH